MSACPDIEPEAERADGDAQSDDRDEPVRYSEIAQAEEPIEDRLRRAWLNGFREGVERSAYIGRWDHS